MIRDRRAAAAAIVVALVAAASLLGANPASAIQGGRPAKDGEFPWTASLEVAGQHVCAATIYNGRTLLTAAHCVARWEWTPQLVMVRYGSRKRTSGAGVRLDRIVVHPGYRPRTHENDIAVLHTAENLVQGPNAGSVCLPEQGSTPDTNEIVKMSGWGAYQAGGRPVSWLEAIEMVIVDRDSANNAYNGGVTDNMIAAGASESGGGAATWDDGDPLVKKIGTRQYLVGIYSWGGVAAPPGHPDIFTRVGQYVDNFIASNVDESTTTWPNNPCGGATD